MTYKCGHEICPILEIELIPLTQGRYAIVDKDDYPELSKHNWNASRNGYGGFDARRIHLFRKERRHIRMHRHIMGLILADKMQIDHINHYTLDNRRRNLRVCTKQQNLWNKKSYKNTSSNHKGVCWDKRDSRWQARIMCNKKSIYLGLFRSENQAAIAYNDAARKYFGEFAYMNEIQTL